MACAVDIHLGFCEYLFSLLALYVVIAAEIAPASFGTQVRASVPWLADAGEGGGIL